MSLPRDQESWDEGGAVLTSSAAVFGRTVALQVQQSCYDMVLESVLFTNHAVIFTSTSVSQTPLLLLCKCWWFL